MHLQRPLTAPSVRGGEEPATILPRLWSKSRGDSHRRGVPMKRIDLRYLCAAPAVAAVLFVGSAALAADCHDNGSFEAWLERFKAEAVKQGISRNAIAAAGPYLVYDQ